MIIKNRDKIPKNKTIRLLFQPAEEGTGGALPMIKEGCLDGVDEVYGYHNIPNFEEGHIRVKAGPVMASSTMVDIKITGLGGHGSVPHLVKDVITCGASIITNFHAIKSRMIDAKENCIFSITKFESGHTYNVYPDEAFIKGTIRAFNLETLARIKEKMKMIAESTAEAFGCKVEFKYNDKYPPTINHETEASHVKRIAELHFGDQYVSD